MTLFHSQQQGGCLVLKLRTAKFDASLVDEFKRAIAELGPQLPKDLVLDISDVRFVDSSALGALVSLYKRAEGSRVRLLKATPAVLGLLKLTRMDRVFELVDTLDSIAA